MCDTKEKNDKDMLRIFITKKMMQIEKLPDITF